MKKIIFIMSILTSSIVFSAITYAATVTGTLTVDATVLSVCSLSTSAVHFGLIDPSVPANSNGSITVNCSEGATYTVSLNSGLNYESITRNLAFGSNRFPYYLYQDNNLTPWGDTGAECVGSTFAGGCVSGTGNGTDQILTVYATSGVKTNTPSGTYSDTVVVTLAY
jgi:spore coat protein U-like protein